MRKGSGTKVRVSLTLNRSLMDQITDTCDKRLMKISNYIERLITIGLKNEKSR